MNYPSSEFEEGFLLSIKKNIYSKKPDIEDNSTLDHYNKNNKNRWIIKSIFIFSNFLLIWRYT